MLSFQVRDYKKRYYASKNKEYLLDKISKKESIREEKNTSLQNKSI